MQFAPGNVVRSCAGRDKGHLYCVISVLADRVLVVDGQRRKVRNPKPKNPLHLELVSQGEIAKTDDEIRQILQSMVETIPLSEEKGRELNGETGCH